MRNCSCAYQVSEFTLTTKMLGFFDVSNLRSVEYNENAFGALVLPEYLKRTLSSLVKFQGANSSQFDDLIEGKRNGLIILLHGLPGVGKTFNAGQSKPRK